MNPMVVAYVTIMTITAVVCMFITVYVWPQRRKNSETVPLVLLLVGITEWICAALMGMLDQNLAHKILWAKIEYIGVLSVPLALLVYVLHHSGIHQWLTRKRLAWLAAIPVLTLVLAWTNEYHRLVWAKYVPYLQNGLAFSEKTYGPAFWIYWGYSYLLLLAATILTIRAMLASSRLFRWQSLLVAIGILAPWVANLLYILHVDPVRNLDLTPLAFGITGLALAFGMFRWQLFDIKPIAQAAVINGMADGLMILDSRGRILEVNPAAQAILGLGVQELVGKPMEETIANRLAPDERSRWLSEKGMEIRLPVAGEYRDYELSTSPFYEKGGSLGGRIIFIHDVTERERMEEHLREAERMQVEQALRLSEDKFKYFFENSAVGKSITQPSGEISVNRAFCELLGYSPQELQSRKWREITHPDDIALTQREIDRLFSGEKEVVRFNKRYIRKDGSVVWTDLSSALRRDQDGHPLYLMTSIIDITGRKQAEEQLRKSEARYQLVFENSGTANTIFDTECRVILQNSLSQKLTMPANALGKTALEIFGPEQGSIVDARMRRALVAGVAEVFETKFSMPKGEKWIRSSYQPLLDEQQGVVGIQVISQDISAQKQAEELLRETSERLTHMLANSPTVIYALKVEGDQATPTWISENIQTVLGFPAEQAMQPAWWLDQVHPQDHSEALASLEHLFDDFYQHEYHFLHKDGQVIWLHDEHRLLRDQNSAPREIIGAWTDISERRLAEEALQDYNSHLEADVAERTRELQETQEKLVRQEKLAILGQMAGSVGHELRNPLGVINSSIYYLKMVQPQASQKVKEYHTRIEQEVRIADKIISDLLDFARVKSVDRQPLAVPDLVQHVLERFPGPESIVTALELPTELPMVFVDPRQMEQVLGNLTTNACQAMPAGGQLTVSGEQFAIGGQQWVRISVKDTGTGITPENMRKLFEPLFTTKPRGIGLGLAVCKKLAEANGGRIEVQSEPGKGSTFMLYLPVFSS